MPIRTSILTLSVTLLAVAATTVPCHAQLFGGGGLLGGGGFRGGGFGGGGFGGGRPLLGGGGFGGGSPSLGGGAPIMRPSRPIIRQPIVRQPIIRQPIARPAPARPVLGDRPIADRPAAGILPARDRPVLGDRPVAGTLPSVGRLPAIDPPKLPGVVRPGQPVREKPGRNQTCVLLREDARSRETFRVQFICLRCASCRNETGVWFFSSP
jgi:hypothetical protein